MDELRDLDLDQLMENIRLKVHESRKAEAAASTSTGEQGELTEDQRDLKELHRAYDLDNVSLDPNRKVLGSTWLMAARAVRGLLAPIIRRQSEYNAANTRLTTKLKTRLDQLRPEFAEFRSATELALTGNFENFKTRIEELARRFARTYGEDLAMHSQALRDLSDRLVTLEQQQRAAMEQRERLELLERRQTEMRQELDRFGLDLHSERLQHQEQQLRELFEQNQRLEALNAQCSEMAALLEQARTAQSEIEERVRSQSEELKLAHERVLRSERRLRRFLSAGPDNTGGASNGTSVPVPPAAAEFDYAGFEDRLRDSRMVKEKQRIYVEYFAGNAPVIDAGCGKGEFLELMREAGIEARGIDLDLDMVLLCKEKGLEAHRGDILEYLAEQPEGSIGGIFSAQVIEHLSPQQLGTLISLAWHKLKPGGIVVLETLNPESLFVHYKWFWMDPSHVLLVHPQTLQFLLESGFAELSCHLGSPPAGIIAIPPLSQGSGAQLDEFNRATDYLNKLIYGDQEYFVVARK
jgi:O-antigen chain-terminating methyltransferase